jgi:RND family efflux transporter MFP subunit
MSEQRHSQLGIHSLNPGEPEQLLKRRQIVRRTKIVVLAVLILLAAGAARTVISRMSNARALEAGTAEHARQYVKTVVPKAAAAGQALVLPGTLQGFVQSPIAARASGYLRRWYKDIGTRVEKGDLLAEIETPEIDQQLSQAVAARQQAASSLALAKSTLDRWEALREKGVVSLQGLDEHRSVAEQARSSLAAAEANVERLRQIESFKRVLAPFAGVITRRNVDVGDLIDAGATGGPGRALFLLTQTDPLRLYVNVPQSYAQLVKPGQQVTVAQTELRGQTFAGTVARTAASIDAATRTMQVEISLPNRDGMLLPGAYVQVSLPLQPSGALVIPTNALLFRREGTRVAVVDATSHARLKTIQVGRNYGETVEVLEGIVASDRLVLNPSDSLADGDEVVVAPATAAAS